jgi:hypothetical protein
MKYIIDTGKSPEKVSRFLKMYALISVLPILTVFDILISISSRGTIGFILTDPILLFSIAILVLLAFVVYGGWFTRLWVRPLFYVILLLSLMGTAFMLVGGAMDGSNSIVGSLYLFGSIFYLLVTVYMLVITKHLKDFFR